MRKRVLIIGQAPGARGGPVLGGACGLRLAKLAGLATRSALLERARLDNLLDAFPGRVGWCQGDRFPMREARAAAERRRLRGLVILLGRGVASAFRVEHACYFRWLELGTARVAVVPHPSGVSRWWNDPRNVRRASRFLRKVLASSA